MELGDVLWGFGVGVKIIVSYLFGTIVVPELYQSELTGWLGPNFLGMHITHD